MVRDPETGKRVIRENPKSEWQHKDVPELRIVDNEIWKAVQARQRQVSSGKRQSGYVRKKRLLSGLIKCGLCSAPMVVDGNNRNGKARIICSRAKETKQCSHSRRYYLDAVEDVVLNAFSKILESKENVELFIGACIAERKRLAQEAIANRARLEAALKTANDDKRRLVELYCKGHVDETYVDQEMPIKNLAIEQAKVALEVAPPVDRVALNEEAIHAYRAIVTALAENIETRDVSEPLMQRFREFVGPVIVKPSEAREPLTVELYGVVGSFIKGAVCLLRW
jgi:site-specific DNA recombinase